MTVDQWITIGITIAFTGIFSTVLWAIGRYVLPRPKGNLEDQIEALQELCGDWEKKWQESDKQNRKLEDRQEFLLDQLERCNVQIYEQGMEIQQLRSKIADLERANPAIKQTTNRKNQAAQEISVLMVAPRSNLPLVDAEMQDVLRSGLDVTPVYSPLSQVQLTREIRSSEADGLWLAGHMDAQGNFPLDNGDMLTAPALTALVRGRFEWVFINSCQSAGTAQMIQNETDAAVICTVVDVPDQDAYRTGSLFAHALARSGDTRKAYNQSIPGNNRTYLYLGGARRK